MEKLMLCAFTLLFVMVLCESNGKEDLIFERIYVINLKRRTERRLEMEKNLKIFKKIIPHSFFDAIDGSNLTKEWLKQNNFDLNINWRDPYFHRVLTNGESGCILSHYKSKKNLLICEKDEISSNFINLSDKKNNFFSKFNLSVWEEIVKKGETSLILEDDAGFNSDFFSVNRKIKKELKKFDFDLVYLYRAPKYKDKENPKIVSESLVKPKHSFSTAAYV